MKILSSLRLLPILCAGALLAFPAFAKADSHGHGGGHDFHGHDFHDHGFHDHFHHFGPAFAFGFGYYPYWYGGPYYGPYDPYYYGDYYDGYDPGAPVYRGIVHAPTSGDLVTDVQRALKHRGYNPGSVDGQNGPATREAIRAYQSDRGLPVTGHIDSNLVHSLGLG